MRSDAVEFHLSTGGASMKRRPARNKQSNARTIHARRAVAPAAIDEAFATLERHTGRITRLDAAARGDEVQTVNTSAPRVGGLVPSRSLRVRRATQLDILDQQRAQLRHLLSCIHPESCD